MYVPTHPFDRTVNRRCRSISQRTWNIYLSMISSEHLTITTSWEFDLLFEIDSQKEIRVNF